MFLKVRNEPEWTLSMLQLSNFLNPEKIHKARPQDSVCGLRIPQHNSASAERKMWKQLVFSSLKYFSRLCGTPWKSRCGYLSVLCISGWIAAGIGFWILQATSGPHVTFSQLKSTIALKSNTCILLFQMVKKKCVYAHWLCTPKCLDGNRP